MNHSNPVKLFDMYDGYAPVTNVLGMADPDVHKIDGQWWMFFGGLQDTMKNNLFRASLPRGAPLSSTEWTITTDDSDPHRAVPLVSQPSETEWDRYGLHTPSYLRGIDPHTAGGPAVRERIYYAGRSSDIVLTADGAHTASPYSIGVVEKTHSEWIRHPHPVLTGTTDRPSVLEPHARYYEGMWRLWYVATDDDPNSDEFGRYQLQYVESEDGITNWSTPQTVFSPAEGYFDAAVTSVDNGYEMIISRHGAAPEVADAPQQGLWWLASKTPSGERTSWTADPVCIVGADHGASWHTTGIHGPNPHYGDTVADRDTLHVFFNGIYHPAKPPFPAPFFCAIGRIDLQTQRGRRGEDTRRIRSRSGGH